MPPNYRQDQPLKAHERKGVFVLVAAVVLVCAGLGTWELAGKGGGPKETGKCVALSVASSTGGGQLRHCGNDARAWCATETTATGELASEIQAACRRAGFRSGPGAGSPRTTG